MDRNEERKTEEQRKAEEEERKKREWPVGEDHLSERLLRERLTEKTRWGQGGSRKPAEVSQRETEREVKIRGLMMDPVTNMPVVVLKAVQGPGTLPIWVGIYEANAIALEIEKVQTPRPMTHDLLKNVLLGLDVRVNKVVVSDLKDETFYALIWMERGGEIISMDSRPSDALALALRLDCPIYVEERVFKSSQNAGAGAEKTSNEELKRWLESLNDEDLGRYKM
ncbi:MAG: bifunctional nuclease family protein [Candidatus Acidiferrales bacterium]